MRILCSALANKIISHFSRKLEETTIELKKMASALEIEKERTDQLLRELLPPSVAEQLRQGKQVEAGMATIQKFVQ